MFLYRLLLVALLQLAAARTAEAQAAAANAELWKECQNQQSDQALKACTQIIDGKAELGVRLAQAYNMRALAHQRMGQPDAAIADFSQGIQLMKEAGKSGWELAFLYFMRANTYPGKGDRDQVIADHSNRSEWRRSTTNPI